MNETFVGLPATLPSASLPACLAALLCHGLPGFCISDISDTTDLSTLLKSLEGDTWESDWEGGSRELDKDGHNTSQHLQGNQNMEPNLGKSYTQGSNGTYFLALGADMDNFILSTVPTKPAVRIVHLRTLHIRLTC